jgi:hypothetical protein
MALKPSDIPLVRGGKLTPKMLQWIEKVIAVFPEARESVFTIRKRPNPAYSRGAEIGSEERESIGKSK